MDIKKAAKKAVKSKAKNTIVGIKKGDKKGGKKGLILGVVLLLIIGVGGFFAFQAGLLDGLFDGDETAPAITLMPTPPPAEAPPMELPDGDLIVTFINVGQGDAILIRDGNSAVLIDAGDQRPGTAPIILEYLENAGVTTLNYIVGTHPHADHIGSFATIINSENVTVEAVVKPDQPHTTQVYNRFLTAIEDNNVRIVLAERGERIQTGSIDIMIVAPGPRDVPNRNLNNTSVVLHLTHGVNTFLFTGDAEVPSEQNMVTSGLDLSADIMQAGHHGSRTSSSVALVDAVNPSVIAISVGAGNKYGHPHPCVMERFEQIDAQIFRTDELGHLVFVSNGQDVQLPDGTYLRG